MAFPTVRLLYFSIMEVWTMSANAISRRWPKYSLSKEKARSADAEFGVKEKTIWAAFAQAGKLLPCVAHHLRIPSVKPSTFYGGQS